jgi:hypothetical protein
MPTFAPHKSSHDLSQIELTMKDDHRYDSLRNLDDHSDSSTEVGDWDTQVEEKPRQNTIFWMRAKAWSWLLNTSLLLIIVGLLAEKRWKLHHIHAYELAGDITGFAPSFSQQIITFRPNTIYAPENASEFWSPETKQAWLDIVPGRYSNTICLAHPFEHR